eukprot:gene20028-30824_t
MDLAQVEMMVCSEATLLLAAWRTTKTLQSSPAAAAEEKAGSIAVDKQTAVAVPVAASAALLSVYFFPGLMFWFQIAVFSACSVYSVPHLLRPVRSPSLSPTVRLCLEYGTVSILAVAWLSTGYWVFHDLLAVLVCAFILVTCSAPNGMVVAVLLFGVTLYDDTYLLLGAGDVVLPGVAGVTIYVMTAFKTSQPALLYLAPFTVLPPFVLALVHNDFLQLWK